MHRAENPKNSEKGRYIGISEFGILEVQRTKDREIRTHESRSPKEI
jgi:hypothetical protein